MKNLPEPFLPLAKYDQFVLYSNDKVPLNRHLKKASITDPQNFMSFDEALALSKKHKKGIGFVFTENDPFFLLDLDKCVFTDEKGCENLSPFAKSLLRNFQSVTARERSISGKGLHLIGICKKYQLKNHACKSIENQCEFYTENRYVALTGDMANGKIQDCTALLLDLVKTVFKQDDKSISDKKWTNSPVKEWKGYESDEELLAAALNSESVNRLLFSKCSFRELWEKNEEALTRAYPSSNPHSAFDGSSADMALASHLAFWTGKNCERIQELMMQSELRREKWDREDYLRRTILKACQVVLKVYSFKPKPVERDDKFGRIIPISMLPEFFKGCVYVKSEDKVYFENCGYTKSQFFALKGGYLFVYDSENSKSTRNPWDALMQNTDYRVPIASNTCFLPLLDPGKIVSVEGENLLNTYEPLKVERKKGNVFNFLEHLSKLFPDDRDQKIVLSYLAAIVQYPGIKFKFCLVIQGVQGNGKSLLAQCVANSIGKKYVHYPKSEKLTSRFNGWQYGKLLAVVEDMFEEKNSDRIFEILKPMITEESAEIEEKGKEKSVKQICVNYILTTNSKTALKKTKDDRRYCILYTPQQEVEDLARDGLDEKFFKSYTDWLRNDGFAKIAEYLHTYPISDDFNPAVGCLRAPKTSSTDEAILESRDDLVALVFELISESPRGLKNGWVSSVSLNRELRDHRAFVNPKQIGQVLKILRYLPHPDLSGGTGRSTATSIIDDGKRPVLYIHEDLVKDRRGDTAKKIMSMYEDDQKN